MKINTSMTLLLAGAALLMTSEVHADYTRSYAGGSPAYRSNQISPYQRAVPQRQVRRQYRSAFDTNRDGRLDTRERRMVSFDANRDGVLSRREARRFLRAERRLQRRVNRIGIQPRLPVRSLPRTYRPTTRRYVSSPAQFNGYGYRPAPRSQWDSRPIRNHCGN